MEKVEKVDPNPLYWLGESWNLIHPCKNHETNRRPNYMTRNVPWKSHYGNEQRLEDNIWATISSYLQIEYSLELNNYTNNYFRYSNFENFNINPSLLQMKLQKLSNNLTRIRNMLSILILILVDLVKDQFFHIEHF